MGFSSSVGPAFWKCHSHPRWHFCFSQGLQADIPSLSRSRAPIVTAGFQTGGRLGKPLEPPAVPSCHLPDGDVEGGLRSDPLETME